MKHTATRWIAAACTTLLLSACAMVDDKAQTLFATNTDAIALVNGQLLVGKLQLAIDHTGTLSLWQPDPGPTIPASGAMVAETTGTRTSCTGRFRYSSTTAGSVDLRCNDGTSVELTVALLSETRGYGYGQNPTGPASMTFGLAPQAARAYLLVPAGKQLKELKKAPFFELL